MADWRILVADDEPYVVLAIKEVLESMPARVLQAYDGQDALDQARAEQPDLILLDVRMPKLDGFQVASALKQDPGTASIPLIFFSALASPGEKVRGLDLGAEDYLAKPIDAEELKARVRTVLRRGRIASTAPARVTGGQLQTTSLPSLIQQLEGERRTTCVRFSRGDAQGEIAFVDGHVAQAAQGPRQGEAAVYQLLTWQEGTFHLVPLDTTTRGVGGVAAPNQGLLLEGNRRQEELPALRGRLAQIRGSLRVPPRVREAVGREAPAAMAELIALLDGSRDLESVLEQSPFDAWATLKTLLRLLAVGALVAAEPGAERRGGLRLKVGLPIEYQSLGLWQQSATFNLSAWGVFIRTAVPFDTGEQVVLRFQLPGQDNPVRVMGRVVWANADPSKWGGMGMGIQFLDLTTTDREAIENHLAQLVAVQIGGASDEA
jgi:two-component system, OmpR family, alkaline phosphatase synthesis response regulator PhoP